MSLDNVLAVAGAGKGNLWLIGLGLAISIPLIMWGSQLMCLMNRFPIIVMAGAGLLGYTAGEMIFGDKAIARFIESSFQAGHYLIPIVLALLVIGIGKAMTRKKHLLEQSVPNK